MKFVKHKFAAVLAAVSMMSCAAGAMAGFSFPGGAPDSHPADWEAEVRDLVKKKLTGARKRKKAAAEPCGTTA